MVGVISEADLMRREELGSEKTRPWWLEAITPGATLAKEFAQSHGKRVKELMSSRVISVTRKCFPQRDCIAARESIASNACPF